MSNFSPKIEDSTEKELLKHINELPPIFGSIASDELTRRTIKDFKKTIKEEIKASKRLSKILLTVAFIQIIITLFQFSFDIVQSSGNLLKTIGIIFLFFCAYMIYDSLKDIKK